MTYRISLERCGTVEKNPEGESSPKSTLITNTGLEKFIKISTTERDLQPVLRIIVGVVECIHVMNIMG